MCVKCKLACWYFSVSKGESIPWKTSAAEGEQPGSLLPPVLYLRVARSQCRSCRVTLMTLKSLLDFPSWPRLQLKPFPSLRSIKFHFQKRGRKVYFLSHDTHLTGLLESCLTSPPQLRWCQSLFSFLTRKDTSWIHLFNYLACYGFPVNCQSCKGFIL